jgi:chitinase
VTFDGTASDDPDGDIVRYDWDFGDGTTVTDAGPAPDHTYAEDGRYRVTLTVTDNSGETDTGITVVTVGVGNLPPEADAGDSVNGKVRRDITFDGTGSSDRDGNVVSYAWEFGDGNTDTGSNPTHSYADAGKYRVTMTVKDNDGATSSDVTLADVESKSGGGGGGGGGSCFINTLMGQ